MTDDTRFDNTRSSETNEVERGDALDRTDTMTGKTGDAPRRDWDRKEWAGEETAADVPAVEADRAEFDTESTRVGAVPGERAHWNAHEFVGEGQGAPDEGPTGEDVTEEGDNDLSGHGHNPGGGERWADVDKR